MGNSTSSNLHVEQPYDVFISCAGPDLHTMATPLYEKLKSRSINAFVDIKGAPPSHDAEPAMIEALKTAPIGVFILSIDFVASKWPVKQLFCLLRRLKEAESQHYEKPLIIPVFYRLDVKQCYDIDGLIDSYQDGKNPFIEGRFIQRLSRGEPEANLEKLRSAFRRLSAHMGIENDVGATNEDSAEMEERRDGLLEKAVYAIAEALEKKNMATIDKAADSVGYGNASSGAEDRFQASYQVPENPPHVVLNFGSISDTGDHAVAADTVEAKLKRAVLRSDESRSVGDVGRSLDGGVGVMGMGGVGKTCALRGVGNDVEVRSHFRDGIYFMVLGKYATEADVIREVADMMRASGSNHLAKEARESENIEEAVSKARKWFSGRRMLLMIDDVWEESRCGRDIVTKLSRVADVESGSRIVFSSRDIRMTGISRHLEVICFRARDDEESRKILLAAAVLEEEEVVGCAALVDEVVGYCGGIPMALAVAGSAIKIRILSRSGDKSSVGDVWEEYARGLRRNRRRLVKQTVDNDPYASLESTFRASLEMLDGSKTGRLVCECKMSIFEMYKGLVVQRRQGWTPVNVLMSLWECEDEWEAIDVMQELVGASLARREFRTCGGKRVPGIMLHDLQLDFVEGQVKDWELKKWHRKVLSLWSAEEQARGEGTDVPGGEGWAKDEVLLDEYARNNVCRHLLAGGRRGELHRLLRNPRWAAQRLRCDEIASLEEDFGMLFESWRQESRTDAENEDEVWCLKMIAGAARLSAGYVSRNRREVWFQLRTRLLGHAEKWEDLKKYVDEIEKIARGEEGVWAKALTGCLPEPGRALEWTMLCDGHVYWISELDGNDSFVVCGIAGGAAAFVSMIRKGRVDKPVWLGTTKALRDEENDDDAKYSKPGPSIIGSTRDFATICCTRDRSLVVTGHWDGRLQVWKSKTGEPVGTGLWGHDAGVESVAWSPDGKWVASGGRDGTVLIWHVETGEKVGEALRGHSGYVVCVAWSLDGKCVASGGEDGMARVWDIETGEPVGEALHGHSGYVGCVAWSSDGKHIVSGGADGTVRVWDVEKGEAVGEALRGHSNNVYCVAWSPDGTRIVSGGADSTVRVWDVEEGEAVWEALRGHSHAVWCVAWWADGRRIVSGGSDGTVRVWDVENGGAVDEAPGGHGGTVSRVVWSRDGKRVSSGGSDGMMRVWDVETGECVATEGGWQVGDRARLKKLLGEDDVAFEEETSSSVQVYGPSVVYRCDGEETVVATLEESPSSWAFSQVSECLAVGRQNGCVDFLKLAITQAT